MANHELASKSGRAFRTERDVLDELHRLRVIAARKRGKVRLSLQDLAAMSGVPKSSLANYLSGRTLMPADVLDRLIIALGVAPSEARIWAESWERIAARRLLSRSRLRRTIDDEGPTERAQPFAEDHEEVFHRHERLTAELVRLVDERLGGLEMLAVTGPSGVGKSALLRAGLLPAIDRGQLSVAGAADWPRLVLTPTGAPLGELAAQLAELAGVDVPSARRTLARQPSQARVLARQAALAHWAALPADRRERCRTGRRLVLIVDQFEEVFTHLDAGTAGQDQRSAYLAALLSIAMTTPGSDEGGAGLVILAIRDDYLDHCQAYPGLVPTLRDARFVVGPVHPAEPSRVSTGPAGAAEPWLLRTLAEEVYATLTTREQEVARRLFLTLTTRTADGVPTRRRATRAELDATFTAFGKEGPGADWRAVVKAFAVPRLIVLDHARIEVAHESLLRAWPRLLGWLDDEQDEPRRQPAAGREDSAGDADRRIDSGLYRGSQLLTVSQTIVQWPVGSEADGKPTLVGANVIGSRRVRTNHIPLATATAIAMAIAVAVAGLVLLATHATLLEQDGPKAGPGRRMALPSVVDAESDPQPAGLDYGGRICAGQNPVVAGSTAWLADRRSA